MTHRFARPLAALASLAFGATAAVLGPASPAGASTAGSAIFFASPNSSKVVVTVGSERATLDAFPTAQVLAGHFTDGLGAQAVLYNPGPGPDGFVTAVPDGPSGVTATLDPIKVDGRFRPFVADFDRNGFDDIFWYAPGVPADHIWFFEEDGSHFSQPLNVQGSYEPVPFLIDGGLGGSARQSILWYGNGSRSDAMWTFHGRTPVSTPVRINGEYQIAVGRFSGASGTTSAQQIFFYDYRNGPNALWSFLVGTTSHRSDPMPRAGFRRNPLVADVLDGSHDALYWYSPGPGHETVWTFQGTKVSIGTAPEIGSTSRVLRKPGGSIGGEEVVLLSEGTTARTLQLAPEGAPTLGTVTTITGLPTAPRADITTFGRPI